MILTKFILVLILVTVAIPQAWGRPADTLKNMVADEVYRYAKQLYDRHDYKEAANAFKRVLSYNPKHSNALLYMTEMGYVKPTPVVECCAMPASKPIVIKAPVLPVVIDPNDDIKQEIALEDAAIHTLTQDIARMRTTAEDVSHE